MISGLLVSAGMSILGGLFESGTEVVRAKTTELIKDKTGIDLNGKGSLSQEDIETLKKFETGYKKELLSYHLENTKSAREMNANVQDSDNASWMAKNGAYYMDFIIILATIGLGVMLFFVGIPADNLQIANIMFGTMLGYVSTVINYHRGSAQDGNSRTVK